jgi:SAM-dependent methyltransferase
LAASKLPRVDERIELNRLRWDEQARLHAQNYPVDDVRGTGFDWLKHFEVQELGNVEGQSICHLQCHIGGGSIALSRLGATVVGVDFSPVALDVARARSERAGVAERVSFVCASVDEAPRVLAERFDGVYTSWGVLTWLPSLVDWAHAVAELLKPSGWLYLVENHPIALVSRWPDATYGTGVATFDDSQGDYTDDDVFFEHPESWNWNHGLGEIVTAIAEAGMRIEWLHEHQVSTWHYQDKERFVQDETGMWRDSESDLPLSFSLRATRDR